MPAHLGGLPPWPPEGSDALNHKANMDRGNTWHINHKYHYLIYYHPHPIYG
jgi:hypothetical protein